MPTTLCDRFSTSAPVVGMVHLPALPGSPGFDGDRSAIRDRALTDATTLLEGGVDGLLVENFGDAPFYPDSVPTHVVADLTAIVADLTDAVDVPVGVNVLRNDATAALSVAAAAGASFVHVAAAATDQGLLEGRAHETLRLRESLDADVDILADVHVKHATPLDGSDLERATRETVERGLADGVIVSGAGTGVGTALEDVECVAETAATLERRVPVFVGSGVTVDTVGDLLEAGADGAIVGTALKEGGETTNPVSLERVRDLLEAADDRRA